MNRAATIVIHLLALPIAVICALFVINFLTRGGPSTSVAFRMNGSEYIVACLPASTVAGSCVLVLTLVTVRYRTLTRQLLWAWFLLFFHLIVGIQAWPGGIVPAASEDQVVVYHLRGFAVLFMTSWAMVIAASVSVLAMSLRTATLPAAGHGTA